MRGRSGEGASLRYIQTSALRKHAFFPRHDTFYARSDQSCGKWGYAYSGVDATLRAGYRDSSGGIHRRRHSEYVSAESWPVRRARDVSSLAHGEPVCSILSVLIKDTALSRSAKPPNSRPRTGRKDGTDGSRRGSRPGSRIVSLVSTRLLQHPFQVCRILLHGEAGLEVFCKLYELAVVVGTLEARVCTIC